MIGSFRGWGLCRDFEVVGFGITPFARASTLGASRPFFGGLICRN